MRQSDYILLEACKVPRAIPDLAKETGYTVSYVRSCMSRLQWAGEIVRINPKGAANNHGVTYKAKRYGINPEDTMIYEKPEKPEKREKVQVLGVWL
jgi:DNA-binding transcriptional regulator PaaX